MYAFSIIADFFCKDCSDASKLTRAGLPAVVFGPGNINQAHTKDEWVEVKQVIDSTKILMDTIMHFKVD